MWLCTKHGFFSIKRDANDRYFIRARVRGDLENLCDTVGNVFVVDGEDPIRLRFVDSAPDADRVDAVGMIQDWPSADYRYRLIVDKDALLMLFAMFAGGIDYPNFKSEVAQHPDQRRHLHLYHEVWGTMARLQD